MRILVVDDDPLTVEALQASLEAEGFDVCSALEGERALELWEKRRPALICLDIMMPRMDGFEVCRRIRATDLATPILFLSAKNEEIDVVVGLELGADDFIRKPFGKRELLARIRAVLRRGERGGRPLRRFTMGHWTVFPDALRAEDGETEVELSPREVGILRLLHERAGQAVHRDVFLDECWGQEYYPESRTLDQHVSKLRKRIERDPQNPELIETVRGVGYRYRPR